jgi:hypothetical protein
VDVDEAIVGVAGKRDNDECPCNASRRSERLIEWSSLARFPAMAPRIQIALTESVDPPGWLVRVVGSGVTRYFERLEDAETYARSLAWTPEGRQRARRMLKAQPA